MTVDRTAAEPPAYGRHPLYGPELAKDPAGVYARLRAHGPLAPVELAPGVPATLVTGYETALSVLRDPTMFRKDPRGWQRTVPADCPVPPMMTYQPNCRHTDGQAHGRLRAAVTDSLAQVDLHALRGYVERAADRLIGRFAGKGAADLVADYAQVLPLLVFTDLLGCPPDLSDRLMQGIATALDAQQASEVRGAAALLVRLKRAEPAHDVTSWLAAHPARLTDDEMVHQILALLGAGIEPTQNIILNGLRLLLSDDRFAGNLSGGNLQVEDAIDEILWTDPPLANFAITYPAQDVDLAGVRLPKNQPVVISLAAANTDPALATEHREGNRAHLAWGAGPHTCPAQAQARLIASVAIEKVLDALPEMELAIPNRMLKWRSGPFHRAVTALPVNFPPATLVGGIPVDAWRSKSAQSRDPAPADGLAALLSARRPPPQRRRWFAGVRQWFRRL